MPELDFLGKGDVYAHHLTVPFQVLETDARKSCLPKGGKPDLGGNLIIHGDNLKALKALLPRYEGKVNCIYIDPPYNTGNEGWAYNDNVNSPMITKWLGKVVDAEDQVRHDKWMCMMWPRLQLLKDLLADDGVIFISIDDNEQHRLRSMMDEIFGEENFVEQITWHRKRGKDNSAKFFSKLHEYALVYAKNIEQASIGRLEMTEATKLQYKNPDNDPRGDYRILGLWSRQQGGTDYAYTLQSGQHFSKRLWLVNKEKMKQMEKENILVAKNDNLYYKKFLTEHSIRVVETIWLDASNNANAKDEIKIIFSKKIPDFETPKPTPYLKRIIEIGMKKNGIVLDSFAGSGTTAQAILELNKEDGGSRKFLLVECEGEIADAITAERVRRVIKGVKGTKDEMLRKGLGGSFTYCTLGEELSEDKMLTGESLPDYDTLAAHIFWTATGETLHASKSRDDWFIGESARFRVHLVYKPDPAFLKSNNSALTGDLAEKIAKRHTGKKILVYAPAVFVGRRELVEKGIVFCQLPWTIHQRMSGSV